jgi:hypothetical protein
LAKKKDEDPTSGRTMARLSSRIGTSGGVRETMLGSSPFAHDREPLGVHPLESRDGDAFSRSPV